MNVMYGINISPLQGLYLVALPLHRASPRVSIFSPFRASHEVAICANDGCSPSEPGNENVINHEAAICANDGCSPSEPGNENVINHEAAICANDGCSPSEPGNENVINHEVVTYLTVCSPIEQKNKL
jgi:hypothetical protein